MMMTMMTMKTWWWWWWWWWWWAKDPATPEMCTTLNCRITFDEVCLWTTFLFFFYFQYLTSICVHISASRYCIHHGVKQRVYQLDHLFSNCIGCLLTGRWSVRVGDTWPVWHQSLSITHESFFVLDDFVGSATKSRHLWAMAAISGSRMWPRASDAGCKPALRPANLALGWLQVWVTRSACQWGTGQARWMAWWMVSLSGEWMVWWW